jgi:hypothetical protein
VSTTAARPPPPSLFVVTNPLHVVAPHSRCPYRLAKHAFFVGQDGRVAKILQWSHRQEEDRSDAMMTKAQRRLRRRQQQHVQDAQPSFVGIRRTRTLQFHYVDDPHPPLGPPTTMHYTCGCYGVSNCSCRTSFPFDSPQRMLADRWFAPLGFCQSDPSLVV